MQDKEIDQLFRSQFEDFEIEPSTKVWGDITHTLDNDKRKKAWLPYLSMAASILLVAALGWFFIPRDNIKSKKQDQIARATNNKPAKAIIAPVKAVEPGILQAPVVVNPIASKAVPSAKIKDALKPAVEETRPIQKAEETKPAEQLAQNVQRNPEIANPVVPGVETALVAKADVTGEPAFTAQPVVTAQALKPAKVLAAAPAKKRRINTFGDLINVVVSKVDKRKDKLIEFTSADEDESTITGVNLGFVKIKKQD